MLIRLAVQGRFVVVEVWVHEDSSEVENQNGRIIKIGQENEVEGR